MSATTKANVAEHHVQAAEQHRASCRSAVALVQVHRRRTKE
jgi:hypothetical protein